MPPPALPAELWLRIARFLPDDPAALARLARTSRLFAALAVERRFRHLLLDADDPRVLGAALDVLEQDASARPRVRALTLHPIAVRSACLKIARMHARWSPTMLSPGPPAPDPGLANRLLTTLAHLPALEALTIEWRDPLAAADERAWCGALISALLRALAHRVGELTLVVPYSALGALGITAHAMERLRALAVEIVAPDAAHHGGGAPAVEEGGMEALTTLVNGSSATLVRLEITVRGHSADLASLFGALRSPARLTHLALSIPCDARHLSEPEALARFLGAASTLSGFSFAPTYCCSAPPLGAHHAEDAQDAWYAHAFPKILHAINALTLTLNTTGHSSARVHPALSAPSAACADAHALRLRVNGRIRVLDELRAVLAPFVRSAPAGGVGPTHADANTAAARGRGEGGGGEDSHAAEAHGADGPAGWRGGPEALAIEAHVLGVPLLALLARLLPGLRALEVRYHWVGAAGDADAAPFLAALRADSARVLAPWTALERIVLLPIRLDDTARWACQDAIFRALPQGVPIPFQSCVVPAAADEGVMA